MAVELSNITILESALREKFKASPLSQPLLELFRNLGAFWCHFALHKRKCDLSGKDIISVFSSHCPNPVWTRSLWLEHADPPGADYSEEIPFFTQAETLFRRCPIPHNIGVGNENCDYTDDCWYCKNLLLSHQCMESRECHYSYRLWRCTDCHFSVFSFSSELCTDLINSSECYQVLFAAHSRRCRNSAFLFDCRDCAECFMCWNLRHKQYCIENVQYSKEEYEERRASLPLTDWSIYLRCIDQFKSIVFSKALWKGSETEHSEESTGSYLAHVKGCYNTFFVSKSESCVNFFRGISVKDVLDSVGIGEAELVYSCSNCMGECYDLRFCTNTHKSKYMEYCAYCYGCEHCFGCFGLVGKEYHIFNKPYSPEDFNRKRSEIEHAMKREGSWGAFFPPSFAPNPYEESIASVFFPLSPEEQRARGFRISAPLEAKSLEIAERNALPSRLEDLESKSFPIVFWDPDAQRRVQITERDYRFSKEHGAPLPYNFYASRLKAHCALMPFGGEMRELIDSSGRTFLTALPLILDGRTVSEGEYEDRIVE